jgi:hypothetical protein
VIPLGFLDTLKSHPALSFKASIDNVGEGDKPLEAFQADHLRTCKSSTRILAVHQNMSFTLLRLISRDHFVRISINSHVVQNFETNSTSCVYTLAARNGKEEYA